MADIEINFDPENDLTTFAVQGDLTADEIIEYSCKHYEERPTRLVLWDTSHGSISNIRTDDFQRIAHDVKECVEKRNGGKTAWVTRSDCDFGLAKMYKTISEFEKIPVSYGVFRDADEAKGWLLS